jgi:GcrA cell cycle regulator
MAWTDQRIDSLKTLWADGLSASEIAGKLGGVTRNAVIGKVHRLGLPGRATASRSRSSRPASRHRRRTCANPALRALFARQAARHPIAVEELVIPLHERKSIDTLTPSSCRWPIGDPQQPDFHFCGRTRHAHFPYCETHARRAFRPPRRPKHGPLANHSLRNPPAISRACGPRSAAVQIPREEEDGSGQCQRQGLVRASRPLGIPLSSPKGNPCLSIIAPSSLPLPPPPPRSLSQPIDRRPA